MDLVIEESYISCGCNKTPHAADWGDNGKICFASCYAVGLFNPSDEQGHSRIEQVLHAHTGRVNSVRWVRDAQGKSVDAFVSSSADSTAILTSRSALGAFIKEVALVGHESSVSIADGILCTAGQEYIPNQTSIIVATASVDSTVRIWARGTDTGAVECVDTVTFGTGFALDVRLAVVKGAVLLACAADDSKVHLVGKGPDGRYHRVHTVTGHEDWVRTLDFCWHGDLLLLATGSQDSFVRVYQLTVKRSGRSLLADDAPCLIETEETELTLGGHLVGLRLDTVLMGHENWIYGVAFHRTPGRKGEVRLLTSSMDKSLVLWALQDGEWLETARVGEVGGNTLGFFGGKFSPDGKGIMAHGYQGSFHLWRTSKDNCWEPQVVAGGHLGPVVDVSWAPSGSFLLSVGMDQTTRLHAPWRREGKSTWHEIARPQVHGHDMSCIAAMTDTSFVSGSEEKVVRAFRAPTNFLDNFRRICQAEVSDVSQVAAPEGASVPALGLSNKPVFVANAEQNPKNPDSYFSPLKLSKPPTEENLLQNTLWPEVQKLYGHGYEVHCVAASPDGATIASACHASTAEHAAVILWDTVAWTQTQKLTFHRLTVTQMAFSPTGSHLVTVSRDRRWCLYRRDVDSGLYLTHATGEKTPHTRIIWCCDWAQDGRVFSTGSRDGIICVWDASMGNILTHISVGESVTALAFSPQPSTSTAVPLLLAGTESGQIVSYVWKDGRLTSLRKLSAHAATWARCHAACVRRIRFRPGHDLELASCSDDNSVRIFRINAYLPL